jgi:hypothetical protein
MAEGGKTFQIYFIFFATDLDFLKKVVPVNDHGLIGKLKI